MPHLVLNKDASKPRRRIAPDSSLDVDRIAIASVPISNDWQAGGGLMHVSAQHVAQLLHMALGSFCVCVKHAKTSTSNTMG